MNDMRDFYGWLIREAVGQPEGNPLADLAMIAVKPGNEKDFLQAKTLDQWQALLPPEWRGEINAIVRLYRGYPISDLDYLV